MSTHRKNMDRLLRGLMGLCSGITCLVLLMIIGYILYRGIPSLTWNLLSTEPNNLTGNIGILPNILNTLYIIFVAMIIVLPWSAIKELLFDDDAKKFVELAKDADVPAPDEDNVGYEVEGDDGDVIATVEIAWPDRKVGFMTAEQTVDKEKLEQVGWKILNLFDVADIDTASYFGGDN